MPERTELTGLRALRARIGLTVMPNDFAEYLAEGTQAIDDELTAKLAGLHIDGTIADIEWNPERTRLTIDIPASHHGFARNIRGHRGAHIIARVQP